MVGATPTGRAVSSPVADVPHPPGGCWLTRAAAVAAHARIQRRANPICNISRRPVLANEARRQDGDYNSPRRRHAQNPNELYRPACVMLGAKKGPGGLAPPGSSAQLVTRASRNDVAVDADAQPVVVLILDGVASGRLGCAAQRRIGHGGVPRCRLQLLVDHIEAHIEPRCEVVLGPGADRPEGPVVAALPGVDLGLGERNRTADDARG